MSTPAQRLAWQHDEDTGGLYADPSLDERLEVEDEAFRHWDTYTFASRPPARPLGGTPDANRAAAAISPPAAAAPHRTRHTTARHNRIPAAGGCAGSEAGGVLLPPGASGLATPSVERWMWAA